MITLGAVGIPRLFCCDKSSVTSVLYCLKVGHVRLPSGDRGPVLATKAIYRERLQQNRQNWRSRTEDCPVVSENSLLRLSAKMTPSCLERAVGCLGARVP